jgi:hypothetical protein
MFAYGVPSKSASVDNMPLFLPEDSKSDDGPYIVELYNGKDPGLTLFRQHATRESVVSFYTERTGSVVISVSILENAEKYEIPLPLAFSLSWVESSFFSKAVNENPDSVDRGLFQLNSKSFPDLAEEDFFDPYINAEHGLRYLRKCIELGGNEVVGLAMYNAGRTRVEKGETPRTTLNYIARILDYREQLEKEFSQCFIVDDIVLANSASVDPTS